MPPPYFSDAKSGWLILWKATTDQYLEKIGRPRIVALLDHRVSEGFIEQYLRLLYVTEHRAAPSERLLETHFQSVRRRRSRQGEVSRSSNGELIWGDNPWLAAMRVNSFYVVTHSDRLEIAYWKEENYGRESEHFKMESRMLKSGWRETLIVGSNAVPPPKDRLRTQPLRKLEGRPNSRSE